MERNHEWCKKEDELYYYIVFPNVVAYQAGFARSSYLRQREVIIRPRPVFL